MADLYTDFTKRDYTANFEWLLSVLNQEVPELTDMNHSDAGVSILRLVALATDKLSFYIDEAFEESYIGSAKFKQSIIDIATLVDCYPSISSCANTVVRVALAEYADVNHAILIPKYTRFYRGDSIQYVSLDDYILSNVSGSYVDIVVYQGTFVNIEINSGDFVYSDRMLRPRYNLGKNVTSTYLNVIGSISQDSWGRVYSFWRKSDTDNIFRLDLFGDKLNSPGSLYDGETDTVYLTLMSEESIPNESLLVSFLRSDGLEGNCGSGTISSYDFADVGDDYIYIGDITQITSANGGCYAESITDFRLRVPDTTSIQRRCVSLNDYEIALRSIPGIRHVQAVDRNYTGDLPWEFVAFYVYPTGGGLVSDELQVVIHNYMSDYSLLGDWTSRHIVLSATEVPVSISVRIGVMPGYNADSVISSVVIAINNFFSIDNVVFACRISIASLHSVVMVVAGVSFVEFTNMSSDFVAGDGEIPILGDLNVEVY